MTRKNGENGGRRIVNFIKKRTRLYILLLIGAVVFTFYTFQVKSRSEEGEPHKKKENLPPKKKNPFGLPGFQKKFIPYKGEVLIEHDVETSNPRREATGLDGMEKEEIAAFRLQKISIYSQLGIYEPNYHPFKEYHINIYGSITPGKAWVTSVSAPA